MVEIKHKYKILHFGEVYILTFVADRLVCIDFETDLNASNTMLVFSKLSDGIEMNIIARLETLQGAKVKKRRISEQEQKIELWKELYKMTYGIDYQVTKTNKRKVTNIEFSQELITAFFNSNEWYAKEKTIARYVNNYNDIKRKLLGQNKETTGNQKRNYTGTGSKGYGATQVSNQELADASRRRKTNK